LVNQDPKTGLKEFRAGWPALLACLLGQAVGVHTLPPYTTGLFIAPLQDAFDWSRTEISLGVTIATLATALGAPLAGLIVNRIGERTLIAASMVIVAACYGVLSAMGPSLIVYWTTMAVMAFLGVGCSPVTLSRILVGAFDRGRGTALGITLLGPGFAGALAPLLLSPLIAAEGWRGGYLALAALVIATLPVIVGLLVLNGAGKPAARPPLARPPKRTGAGLALLVRQRQFWRLLMAFVCVAIGTGGVVVHFVPMLADAGYSTAQAAATASLLGVSIVSGRLLTGVAVDHLFAPRVAALLMGTSAAGFLLLALGGPPLVPFAALFVGMSLGAELDLVAFLTSRYVSPRLYGRAFGLLYAAFLAGVAVSPVIYAELHAAGGDYGLAFGFAAVFVAIAAILFAALPRYPNAAAA
jgi:MFS family permease